MKQHVYEELTKKFVPLSQDFHYENIDCAEMSYCNYNYFA